MAKTASVFARVEPEVKQQAERVLNQLGVPMSNAVDMFLRQVVLSGGIPFDVKIPVKKPLGLDPMSDEELAAAVEEGLKDAEEGRVHTSESVRAQMHEKYGV
ncbi:DNA-damage-inducible protein J [Eubacterium maltosivorans]|uniref:type II toxin-antitoxin system RelB/DinJ family antitoxin n=1 Tax=Eubacterium maltosivorans TaxID=2041044 RepID=UPI00088C4A57|nr:type II toxin-antitoxin system RelB/DinJ family antitoxin [Eubacterium maltosivorans]WPK80716.1 hypothetical protein EUMA32_21280 [Eubacterium maltosivorans]SDO27719.1 DNA-damage-inducible protein J [Eubacterium maltosivorans]